MSTRASGALDTSPPTTATEHAAAAPSRGRVASALARLTRRSTRLSREGKFFLLLVFAVAFGALNTGNNLLYLLLSAMLTLLFSSVVLAALSLRGVEVWRKPPGEIYAGQETFVALGARNHKTRLPSFCLAVRETFGRGRTLDPVFFLHLAPEGAREQGYRCIFPRRGRCRFRGWSVETSFPFGLIVKTRSIDGEDRAVVYPRVEPIQALPLLAGQGHSGQHASRQGQGEDFFSLRAFRDGDDPRRVAWKTSARRGTRLIREFEQEAVQRFELMLIEVGLPERHDPDIEAAITRVASLAVHYLTEGYNVGLTTLKTSLPPRSGSEQQQRILTALALLRHTSLEDPELSARLRALPPDLGASNRLLFLPPAARMLALPVGAATTCIEVDASDATELAESEPDPGSPPLIWTRATGEHAVVARDAGGGA